MCLSLAELQPVLQDLFYAAADDRAAESGGSTRRSALTSSVFARPLVFGLLEKLAALLRDFAHFAADRLQIEVSHRAFAQRFTPATSVFFPEFRVTTLDCCFTTR
jgi:hypothetical protein